MPGHIDRNAMAIQTVLNKTAEELVDLSTGQSSVNLLIQAEEVQFHIVTVCVFVCMFCVFVLTKC